MPMTVSQIVDEAIQLPPAQVAELVDQLTLRLHQAPAPDIDAAWKQEAQRRLAELDNGHVKPISGDEVSARIRQIVGR